ncbi:PKD domain-containing protein [Halorussus aquaticus]|uniref:PKD domain-containing protein n=1 Tax=Halorussus aquaticus TaxID=2953748 RepID=A0ABD5Q1M2_9EURY|nr:PKD domain-containing protein [Halorussus aquaticus]
MMGNRPRTGLATIAAVLIVTASVAGATAAGSATLRQSAESIDARILNFNQQTGSFEPGDTVRAEVEVRNTGDSRHTFFVGYGVRGPDGNWYNNDDRTGTTVTLDPNEREWVTLSWTVEQDAPYGWYDARTSVWAESDRDNLRTRLADESRGSVFEVVEPTNQPPDAELQCTDTEVSVGDTVTCTADRSSDTDGSVTSYQWEFGGQDTDYGETASHTFERSGLYSVELTVTDDEGATDRTSVTVSVEDTTDPPTASLSCSPTEVTAGERVECTASGSSDPDGDISTFDWTFGDGTSDSGEYVGHTFDEAGTYTVELDVSDETGATDTATETIRVESATEPPSASLSCTPTRVTAGERVECTASGSSDPNGDISTYDWTFGDGTGDTGTYASHTFDEAGTYTVELDVADETGATDTVSETIRVEAAAKPPSARLSCSPTEVTVGETVECTASGSSDPNGDISTFDWRFEDGTTGYGERVTHSFDEPGTYSVELDVADETDRTATATAEISVTEKNEKPNAQISYSPTHLERGDTVTFDASDSTDPDGSVSEYKWVFDGTVKRGERVEYSVEDTGDYTVELVVTDGDGGSDTAAQSLSVRRRPTADFDFTPKQPNSEQSVSFTAEQDARVERYEWDFDGDGEYDARGRKVTRNFDSPGKYSVQLHVVGKGDMENTATKIVTVQQNAYFQLTTDRATVEAGSGTAVVMFSVSNHVNDRPLQVKLELDLPDEGVSIQSVAGESPVSRKATDFFTVEAGADESFRVRLQVNEPGTYDIGGKAVYYFGEQEDRRSRSVGPITVGTKGAVQDTGDSETRADDLGGQGSTPGFGPGVALAGLVVAVWLAAKRRS